MFRVVAEKSYQLQQHQSFAYNNNKQTLTFKENPIRFAVSFRKEALMENFLCIILPKIMNQVIPCLSGIKA
jgi:hypothetical protein